LRFRASCIIGYGEKREPSAPYRPVAPGRDRRRRVVGVGTRDRGGEPRATWGWRGDPDTREVDGVASVYERVRSIVAERLGVDEDKVTMEAEFIGDLNADSLDLVEVIMAMEQEFGLEIKDEDAENIRTVGDAVQYIEEHGG
jgi:acyl carrier protein